MMKPVDTLDCDKCEGLMKPFSRGVFETDRSAERYPNRDCMEDPRVTYEIMWECQDCDHFCWTEHYIAPKNVVKWDEVLFKGNLLTSEEIEKVALEEVVSDDAFLAVLKENGGRIKAKQMETI